MICEPNIKNIESLVDIQKDVITNFIMSHWAHLISPSKQCFPFVTTKQQQNKKP